MSQDMQAVIKEYTPGETFVLRNWSPLKVIANSYSDAISEFKDALAKTSHEVSADWPGIAFDDLLKEFYKTYLYTL